MCCAQTKPNENGPRKQIGHTPQLPGPVCGRCALCVKADRPSSDDRVVCWSRRCEYPVSRPRFSGARSATRRETHSSVWRRDACSASTRIRGHFLQSIQTGAWRHRRRCYVDSCWWRPSRALSTQDVQLTTRIPSLTSQLGRRLHPRFEPTSRRYLKPVIRITSQIKSSLLFQQQNKENC